MLHHWQHRPPLRVQVQLVLGLEGADRLVRRETHARGERYVRKRRGQLADFIGDSQ
jgi:hypothetical protein